MIEIAAFPADLSPANPTSGDPISQGHQHINLLKGVVFNTFPSITGVVTATQGDLNNPLLATTRPTVPGLGATQAMSIPYYDTATTASTTPVTAFGRDVIGTANAAALATTIGLNGYLPLAGGTMTGTLVGPQVNIGATSILNDGANGTGNPSIRFGSTGVRIDVDLATGDFKFVQNGVIAMLLQASTGNLLVRGDIVAFQPF